MSKLRNLLVYLCLCLCFASNVFAQNAEAPYLLAPGDIVSVTVFGEPDVSIDSVRVPLSGAYNYPLIGEIQLAGETVKSLAKIIRKKLGAGFLADPKVAVNIVKYRPVIVAGAIDDAGAVDYQEGMTLRILAALVQADADSLDLEQVTIQRNNGRFTPPDIDTLISPGDIVTFGQVISKTGYYYIYGEVNRAGRYEFEPGLTVENSIIIAGGYTPFASKKNIIVRRNGEEKTFKAALNAPLKPGDVITVKKRWF